MYNVKGPSKIVAKTARRGISQNVDNIREYTRNKSVENDEIVVNISSPKPVFHKKNAPNHNPEKVITPQHREIINYINESWNLVYSEAYQENSNSSDSDQASSIFYEDGPCNSLKDFKPFDLESWWGLFLQESQTVQSHQESAQ